MPTDLSPVLLQTPLVDMQTGRVSRPWQLWLIANRDRVGGQRALTNLELETGIVENTTDIGSLEEGLSTTNTTVQGLEGEVSVLQEAVLALQAAVTQLQTDIATLQTDVTTLRTDLDALTVRVETLETWREDVVAALPGLLTDNTGGIANQTVQGLAALTATATVMALRDEINSALLPILRNNYADLTVEGNALRAALLS